MFEWTIQAMSKAHATENDVWEIWTDVASWPKWDQDLEWAALDGEFKTGTKGKLKPKGWFKSYFRITAVENKKYFCNESKMPWTKVIFSHSVAPREESAVQIKHHVRVTGLLAPLLFFTLRNKLKQELPKAVSKLASHAESKNQSSKL